MTKINKVRDYIGKWIYVIIDGKFIKAKLLMVCMGNENYFTRIAIIETLPIMTNLCEMYLVEFDNKTIDYVNEIYDDKTQ